MKFARKSDLVIISLIIVASLLFWLLYSNVFAKSGNLAEIYYKTELVKTVALKTGNTESFSIEQVPHVVFQLYEDGSIAFIESDCHDKVCIQSGKLHLAGQFAACLPNQLYMKIISSGSGDTDAPDMIIG